MASNTEILIKRSLSTDKPTSLLQGELGYSYSSNTLFIGSPSSNGSIEIAGYRDYSGNYSEGAGQYGSTTAIPVITVAANGQITSIETASITTTLGIVADNDDSSVDLATQSLDIAGGEGITTSVSGQTITVDVDTTVMRTNTAIHLQKIDGSVEISGNLTVTGNVTTIDVQTLNVSDPLLYLAGNNYTSDIVDIGFVGNYFDGDTQRHTGVYRHAGDKQYYIFDNYDTEPEDNLIDPTDPSFHLATLHANFTGNTVNVSTLLDVTGNAQITGTLKAGLTGGTTANVVFFDSDTGELKYGGSTALIPSQIANGAFTMSIDDTGLVTAPGKILAAQSATTSGGGFSFSGDEGGNDTGMFSPSDGVLDLYSNNVRMVSIVHETGATFYEPIYLNNGAVIKDTAGGAIAFGDGAAADNNQGSHAIAIGADAGATTQDISAVALGNGAGNSNQSFSAVAIGRWAGQSDQGWDSVAVGRIAGRYSQGDYSVAMGWHAGLQSQGDYSVAIGSEAADQYQAAYAVAIGRQSGQDHQGWSAVALGHHAGYYYQDAGAVAVGSNAGRTSQGQAAVAVGRYAGYDTQAQNAVAVGRYAGAINQGYESIAIGHQSGQSSQNAYSVSVGSYAGYTSQASYSVAVGQDAGRIAQSGHSVALGYQAGYENQGENAIAIGSYAGGTNQEIGAVALGYGAGVSAHQYSVAIGYQAGNYDNTQLGDYAIAIGYRAGFDHGHNNSIVLNASGVDLSASSAGLYVDPIRYEEAQDADYDGLMFYNSSTKEVRYSYALDGGSF